MKQKISAAVLILLILPVFLTAQEAEPDDMPPWLIMERGKTAYGEGDFGTAFRLFRSALEKKSVPCRKRTCGWLSYMKRKGSTNWRKTIT